MSWIDLVGAGSILFSGVVLILLYRTVDDRDAPGSRGFTVLLVGAWLWLAAYGVALLAAELVDPVQAYNLVLLGASLAAIGAFLFVVEYARGWFPSRSVLGGLFVVPAVTQLLAWTNPFHHLIWAAATEPLPGGGVDRVYGPLFYLPHAAFSYGLVLAAIGLLALHAIRSHGVYRRQSGLLVAAFLLVPLADLLNVTVGVVGPRVDPGPFSSIPFVAAVWWVRSRYGFLDLTPVVRARAVDRMRDGMLAVDDRGRILDANDAARSFLGVDGSVVGNPVDAYRTAVAELLADRPRSGAASPPHETRETQTNQDSHEARGAGPEKANGENDVRDGSHDAYVTTVEGPSGERLYELNVSPLPLGTQRAGQLVVIRDVTERERRERELRAQNARLDRFASIVSHDLRNPLHTARGYLDLAEETGEMEHLAAVRRSLDRMDSMIDRLLAMTRAEDAAEHTETVELTAVVDDAWETSHTEGATLRTEIDEARIEASPELLRSVFENLFRNAAAHNDPPVTVRVGTLPDGEGFYVADDGDGIPADDRETVFEHGYTTASDGTGFGLPIVREIVEAHGWSIAIEEGEDGGARFEIVHT